MTNTRLLVHPIVQIAPRLAFAPPQIEMHPPEQAVHPPKRFSIKTCSGKLLLDTKGVVFVQEMVYWRTNKNTSLYKGSQTRTGGLP